ncbi:MAG: outer membrane protein assembly factor BamD [Proteobacteria bacterium]|nr:outer membrane protein assembly factor BamD [Pseudomonadota bacterium]
MNLRRLSVIAAVAVLAACSSTPDDGDVKGSAEKLYKDAKDEMASGSWDAATKLLERVEGRAGGTLLAQQAQIDLAYAHWKGGDKAQALSTLDRFIRLNPSSPAMDYALYLRGLVNFNDNMGFLSGLSRQKLSERDQKASLDAYQSFRQLTEQFPNSQYAADARLRMDYIVNALAEYEVLVARYYFRRGVYLGAVNRAQYALKTYPQAPALEEALYIMMQSYDKLGLEPLRDDARLVLAANFPDSRFLTRGLDEEDKPWWQLW